MCAPLAQRHLKAVLSAVHETAPCCDDRLSTDLKFSFAASLDAFFDNLSDTNWHWY